MILNIRGSRASLSACSRQLFLSKETPPNFPRKLGQVVPWKWNHSQKDDEDIIQQRGMHDHKYICSYRLLYNYISCHSIDYSRCTSSCDFYFRYRRLINQENFGVINLFLGLTMFFIVLFLIAILNHVFFWWFFIR